MTDNTVLTAKLTEEERTELALCETKIRTGLSTFYEVGSALKIIDEQQLYREQFTRFEDYCKHTWGFSGTHAYRQIAAKETLDSISPLGEDLIHERTVRPLALLSDPLEKRIAVQLAYAAATQTIPSGRVTEAMMQTAVATVQEIVATRGHVDLGNGTMQAATASVIVKHNERVKTAIEEAEARRGKATGQVVIIFVRKSARLVSRNGRLLTIEFDSETDLDKLPFSESGVKLELSLNKKYIKAKDNK